MTVKHWLALPFLGGTEGKKQRHEGRGRRERKFKGDEGLTEHMSAANFRSKGEEEIVQDYNAPISWWVISTLFPLIAGTFGPMASAFNICAIAIDWRLIVHSDSTESEGSHIDDPEWLIAVNAVSLAIAILSNLILLAHMTNRIRFDFAAPAVIVGWCISGIIDIALVAAAPTHLPLPDDPNATWSQAYYYCIFSGAIYVLLSLMLSITAFGVYVGQFSQEFKLTLSQRSLMLQTILLLSYILLSGAVYATIEGWQYLDAVYFTVVTLFTIGFGDLTPATHLGRSLFFPFAVGGIIFIGLIIANIRTLVLESASVKVSTRMVEKARFQAIASGEPADGVFKIRGFRRRDTNAPTELEVREKEFNIMREIQQTARHNNRMWTLFLATTAFMILWFIGAVCFWQAEQATGGQNWTYFESVYFVYVAQLTIGYGDFEPQTNSAKPTFVFWALIALPTLTVLIGAVGDAVTESVNWLMVWVGKHVPNVVDFITGLRRSRDKEEALKTAVEEKIGRDENGLSEEFVRIAEIEKGNIAPDGLSEKSFSGLNDETLQKAYRPFLVAKVAQIALGHLSEDSPRTYTYQEWTLILKLLGEDETTEEGHRRIGQSVPDGADVSTPVRTNDSQVWSWMGQESPLLSLEDNSEPKFVLKRLLEVLERDLKHTIDQHVSHRIIPEPTPGRA